MRQNLLVDKSQSGKGQPAPTPALKNPICQYDLYDKYDKYKYGNYDKYDKKIPPKRPIYASKSYGH